jgi:hypothetical protein
VTLPSTKLLACAEAVADTTARTLRVVEPSAEAHQNQRRLPDQIVVSYLEQTDRARGGSRPLAFTSSGSIAPAPRAGPRMNPMRRGRVRCSQALEGAAASVAARAQSPVCLSFTGSCSVASRVEAR